MSKGAWKNHDYDFKKLINGKWRYFYGRNGQKTVGKQIQGSIDKVGAGIKRLGADAKMNAVRASDAARRGASKIIKDAKRAIVNNPISKEQRRKAEAQRLERNRKNRMFAKQYAFDAERSARKYGAVGSGATSREKLNKVSSKTYYKSNNAAIAANRKGKYQTEYYKNLEKKAKERRKKDALDIMTSGGSASDRNQLVSARKYGKSLRSTEKTETKRRNNDLNRMSSGGSASDREALRRAAEKKERARKEQERLKRNAINRAAKQARKNIEASKAAKKQADIDRMSSSTSPKEKWRDLINAGSNQNKTNLLNLANGKKKKNRRR